MSASSKSHKEKDIASAFVSLGVLIMLAAIAIIFFKIEANIAKKKLTALFVPDYKRIS